MAEGSAPPGPPMDETAQLMQNLNNARAIVLADSAHYKGVIPAIRDLCEKNTGEIKRWTARFLAESFAAPTWTPEAKEGPALATLEMLEGLLAESNTNTEVVKSGIQVATSIFRIVFRYVCSNVSSADKVYWDRLMRIKSRVFHLWDNAPLGVSVCCIRFAHQVVLAQTPFQPVDQSKARDPEVSISILPEGHPFIDKGIMVAEAQGLLDRMLDALEFEDIDAILVNATINCLGIMVRTRMGTADRIFNAALRFNPYKRAQIPLSPKMLISIKSMDKTMRALFVSLGKNNAVGPYAPRIQEFMEKMQALRLKVTTPKEPSKKRAAEEEPADAPDETKRQKVDLNDPKNWKLNPSLNNRFGAPLYDPPKNSLGEMFTIGEAAMVDVRFLHFPYLVEILITSLEMVSTERVKDAVAIVKERLASARARAEDLAEQERNQPSSPGIAAEQEDVPAEYKLSSMNSAPFRLPRPAPLIIPESNARQKLCLDRVFALAMNPPPEMNHPPKPKSIFSADHTSGFHNMTFWQILIRRAVNNSNRRPAYIEIMKNDLSLTRVAPSRFDAQEYVRDRLHSYVLQDFRTRIPLAIKWLCEEWYADRMLLQAWPEAPAHMLAYNRLALRLTDGIVPYLDAKDKIWIRYLSELPWLTYEMLSRVKTVAQDPERIQLAIASLKYLWMYRLPARQFVADVTEDIYKTNEGARNLAGKMLKQWRPDGVVSKEEKPEKADGG